MTSAFPDHLNLDTIVAFVDGELGMTPFQRAAAHIEHCPQCRAEVAEQQAARSWLRSAACPTMPPDLLASLRSIPVAAPTPSPLPGVSIDPRTGRAYRTADGLRSSGRGRLFRIGTGALVIGLAVGAVVVTSSADQQSQPVPRPDHVQPASWPLESP